MAAAAVREHAIKHYYAVAEPGDGGTWWLSFPDVPGVFSAADDARQITAQAQDALATAVMDGERLPPKSSIEDGAMPPVDLSEFEQPALVVVIPFAAADVARAA